MAIKVTCDGKVYRSTCKNCDAILGHSLADTSVKKIYDCGHDVNEYRELICPVCKLEVHDGLQ